MAKLSVVITTYNNKEKIKSCIKSAKFAQQIIVVDNESKDDTAKLARKYKATVYSQPNNPDNLNVSKNFGFTKAKHDWVLSLDSDERVDKDLRDEIEYILAHSKDIKLQGYFIPRKNIIFGKWIRHGLWYPDFQLRLFRKGKGKFPAVHNHELLEVKGEVGRLKGHITHFNYQTVSQYIQKIDKQYSNNEADTFLDNKGHIHWYDSIRFPFQDFLTNYFARESYKDGLHGLILSLLQAFYMFIVFCKIWEKQGFHEESVTLDQSQSEFRRIGSQLRHWYVHSKSQHIKPVHRFWLKLTNFF